MHEPKPFTFDENEAPDLRYFTSSDGAHWCDVHAYGITHCIGPYASKTECEAAVDAQIKMNLKMARIKAGRGDLEVKIF